MRKLILILLLGLHTLSSPLHSEEAIMSQEKDKEQLVGKKTDEIEPEKDKGSIVEPVVQESPIVDEVTQTQGVKVPVLEDEDEDEEDESDYDDEDKLHDLTNEQSFKYGKVNSLRSPKKSIRLQIGKDIKELEARIWKKIDTLTLKYIPFTDEEEKEDHDLYYIRKFTESRVNGEVYEEARRLARLSLGKSYYKVGYTWDFDEWEKKIFNRVKKEYPPTRVIKDIVYDDATHKDLKHYKKHLEGVTQPFLIHVYDNIIEKSKKIREYKKEIERGQKLHPKLDGIIEKFRYSYFYILLTYHINMKKVIPQIYLRPEVLIEWLDNSTSDGYMRELNRFYNLSLFKNSNYKLIEPSLFHVLPGFKYFGDSYETNFK